MRKNILFTLILIILFSLTNNCYSTIRGRHIVSKNSDLKVVIIDESVYETTASPDTFSELNSLCTLYFDDFAAIYTSSPKEPIKKIIFKLKPDHWLQFRQLTTEHIDNSLVVVLLKNKSIITAKVSQPYHSGFQLLINDEQYNDFLKHSKLSSFSSSKKDENSNILFLEKWVSNNPGDQYAVIDLMNLYSEKTKSEISLTENCNKLLITSEKIQENKDIYYNYNQQLASCYMIKGDTNKARKLLMSSVAYTKHNEVWLVYQGVGHAHCIDNNYDKAVIFLNLAKKILNQTTFIPASNNNNTLLKPLLEIHKDTIPTNQISTINNTDELNNALRKSYIKKIEQLLLKCSPDN